MKEYFLFFAAAAYMSAQVIPGSYIVEFSSQPAAAVATAKKVRLADAAGEVSARRAEIRAEHARIEPALASRGARITRHFDTLVNAMAVEVDDSEADSIRQLPGVRGVYPNVRAHVTLDHVVNVHRVTDAWKSILNGQAGAGAGIKIGIIDSGIDINHPGFKGFTVPVPTGFPIVSSDKEKDSTNNKVIVARDYTGAGAIDTFGHGSGVAMAAAGLPNDLGINGVAPLVGLAPAAWLGNYRVVDDNGGSDSATFLTALQDAVNDGMNIVNYSSSAALVNKSQETGVVARAIDAALAAGVLVTVAAGNSGPEPGTIGSPAVVPSAIAVASNTNERYFDYGVILDGLPAYPARVPDAESGLIDPVKGPLVDTANVDNNLYGCNAFAADSLKGKIALISRSVPGSADVCTFDAKLTNAAAGGALGAIIYNSVADTALINMSLSAATLPATFVSKASAADIKGQLAAQPALQATIDFTGFTPIPEPSNLVSYFAAGGPTPNAGIKPDVLATGETVITADTTQGSSFPYTLADGTSISAPVFAGALAVLMGARPGLTAADYRSLLINSASPAVFADGSQATPQISGAGRMDLLAAIQSNMSAKPASVSFGAGTGTVDGTQQVVIANLGRTTDTFTIGVNALDQGGITPALDSSTLTLAPGASQAVSVQLKGTGLATGEYHGYLTVTGTKNSVVSRIPYWFGVTGTTTRFISLLSDTDQTGQYQGDTVRIMFRCTDAIGAPFACAKPVVDTTASRAVVLSVTAIGDIPGTYEAQVRVGRADSHGENVFTISADNTKRDVTFFVQ